MRTHPHKEVAGATWVSTNVMRSGHTQRQKQPWETSYIQVY